MPRSSVGVVLALAACSSHDSGANARDANAGDATAGSDADGGSGVLLPDKPHGMFMLDPAGSDIASIFLQSTGAGYPYVAGATLQVHWDEVEPISPTQFASAAGSARIMARRCSRRRSRAWASSRHPM